VSPSEAIVVQSSDAPHARLRQLLSLLDRDQTNAALCAECMSLALDSSDFDCAELLARRALQAQPDDPAMQFDSPVFVTAIDRLDWKPQGVAPSEAWNETKPRFEICSTTVSTTPGCA